ncbi:MAG: Type 1 glutamine amidotransferase-like domain-containing protein, partial [Mesobacillus sp.]|uniref:Type 1 glutamine amidotransferase-like domain-containing protein n=1 Tax=Mesobacillus sp. TaxID=2675271 RepID=UPI003C3E67C9
LIMLSDLNKSNDALTNRIKEQIGNDSFKLGYIPSQTDKERKYFEEAKDFFLSIGVKDFLYFDIDLEFDLSKVVPLTTCDGIYLSGGNTFYFLKKLKERKLNFLLKALAESGKLLIGVSAGAILMSKSIKIAELIDDNEVQLNAMDSLNLVDFEFMPHWETQVSKSQELLVYSLNQERSIYACNDDSGIVIAGGRVDYFGEIYEFQKGEITARLGSQTSM